MDKKALKAAFPHTIPVFTAFMFLGMAYGIVMNVSGFGVWYTFLMSFIVYGGSLQFVAVSMLTAPFSPVGAFLLALMVQARHLFYGLAMLDKYHGLGIKRYYLIFGLTDETFSINNAIEPPSDVDRGNFMFCVTLLNHIYWVAGSVIGALLGDILPFNTEGLDFAMTAMFVAIFINRWKKDTKHYSAAIGIVSSVVCLIVFGADSFIIPTMISILVLLTVFRKPIEREARKAGELI